jgi:putative membrane protein
MKSTYSRTLLLAAFALTSAGLIHAADSKSSLNAADEQFVKTTALAGKSEVQIAELGVKKASSDHVKAIATEMVKDHTVLNTEITALAKSKGVELTSANDPKADAIVVELEKDSGKAFDKAFLKHLQKCHKQSEASYETAIKDSQDAEVKAWATHTLPEIKKHYSQINKALKSE